MLPFLFHSGSSSTPDRRSTTHRKNACSSGCRWLRGSGRLAILVTFFFVPVRRVGEASNPGPYAYGGSSGSHGIGHKVSTCEERDKEQLHSSSDPRATWSEEGLAQPTSSGPLRWPQAQGYLTAPPIEVHQDSPVMDDLEFNALLDEVGLTRHGISPAEVAYRWQAKQDAERMAAECIELDRQWEHLEASTPHLPVPEYPFEQLASARGWVPPAEIDPKKAAKWRARKRRAGGVPHSDSVDKQHDDAAYLGEHELLAKAAPEANHSADSCNTSVKSRPRRATRKSKILDLYTINTSGKPAALTALRELVSTKRSVAAVALQEHHCLPDMLPDFQQQVSQIGWNLVAVPAVVKKEGPSAGVALVTPKHVPAASSQLIKVDLSPAASPGRLASLWVQAGIPGGMLIFSAYLWHTEGMTHRNQEIIYSALSAAKAHGGPWLLVGDLNNAPAVLEQSMGLAFKAAGAAVISPQGPTHYPGGTAAPAVLDYAIVDDRLANGRVLKYIKVNCDLSIGRHRAVQIGISNKGHVAYIVKALKPRSFPAVVPVGCGRKPVDSPATLDQVGLDLFYEDTLACAESEIGRRHDLVDVSGRLQKEFSGRSKGFRTKLRLLLPPRTCSVQGEAGKEAYILRWIHERVVELQYCAGLRRAGSLTLCSLRQVVGLLGRFKKLLKDEGRMEILHRVDHRWHYWISQIVSWGIEGPHEVLAVPAKKALEQAAAASSKHLSAAKGRWCSWVREKLKGGAPCLHQYAKRATEAPMEADESVYLRDVSPQAVLLRDQAAWTEVWTRLSGKFACPWTDEGFQPVDKLEPLTADKVRAAAMTFYARTAVGEDCIRPREVSMLSNRVLDRYAAVMNAAEARGSWPKVVSTNLVHLIPKPSGGRRPIGLLPTLIRVYERARRADVQAWRARCTDPCNYMVAGRTAADAVWVQSVRDEAVRELGMVSASVLLDLIKAFECVRLDVVWRTALRTGFPMAVLRLALRAYCNARRLVYRGIVGDPIFSENAILAGGGLATDLLGLLLQDTIQLLRIEVPRVHLFVVVDDLTIRVEGKAAEVAHNLVRLTSLVIRQLEQELCMRVSRGKKWTSPEDVKSVAVASSAETRDLLATGMRALGIPMRTHARNLGVDYAPGRRAKKRFVQRSRWVKVKAKAKRCRRLGARAATVIARTAITPAIAYGSSSTGMPKRMLDSIRGSMASLRGPTRGRSVTARLALSNSDPVYPIVLAPLWAWWRAEWESILPENLLQAALRGAHKTIEASGHLKHSAIGGGAGAFLSSLERVKWKWVGPLRYLTANGTSFELGKHGDPKMAMRLATRDLEMTTGACSNLSASLASIGVPDGYHRAASAASGFIPVGQIQGQEEEAQKKWWGEYVHDDGKLVPWLKPAVDAIKNMSKGTVSEACVSSFASLIEGGWWTQARLNHAGLASDPFCRACGVEAGTIWHRITCNLRRKGDQCYSRVLDIGKQRWWDPLFSRGVPAWPLLPPMPEGSTWCFPDDASNHVVTGTVFTDGALRGSQPEARRSGWAFAMVDEDSLRLQLAYYGVCDEPWPTVLRAELRAIEEAIRRAVPPLLIFTDSSSAVSAYNKGEKYCCSAKADGADIWKRIWAVLSEFGDFRLDKVKAHTTHEDVVEGFISAHLQAGNAAADYFAVEARKAAEQASPTARYLAHYARARLWYKAVAAAIANWEVDTQADEAGNPAEQEEGPASGDRHGQPPRHELWEWGRAWLCRLCGKTFPTTSRPEKISKAACRGSLHARLLASMGASPIDAFECYTTQEVSDQGGVKWRKAEEREGDLAAATHIAPSHPPLYAGTVRRRLVGKQPDPRAKTTGQAVCRESESGHILIKAGKFTYCDRCGRWAIDRLGPALVRKCVGTVDTSLGAYRIRRDRLRSGRHPLTNEPI